MTDFPNTHHETITYGKHVGERFTRLPISYLRWMVKEKARQHELAEAELNRRNIPLVDSGINISGHAIDTASLRLWAEYRHNHKPNEGLHAWLLRITGEAIARRGGPAEYVEWKRGVTLVLDIHPLEIVVKTCMIKDKPR